MDPLVARDAWLDRPRIVGTPRHWARNGALLGGSLGWLVPSALIAGLVLLSGDGPLLLALGIFNPLNLASALAGAGVGALLGLIHPSILDRVRGRIPILGIAAGQTVSGAVAGAIAGAAWSLPLLLAEGMPPLLHPLLVATGGIGALLGALVAPIWWLPFAVSTVLDRRWPVTLAVAVGFPALLVPLCAGLVPLL